MQPADLIAAVRAADDERVAATISADRTRLEQILSDQLTYAHSNGKLDTKVSLIDALLARRMVYDGIEYRERIFVPITAGAALMRGRAILHVRAGQQPLALDVNYLAVWRQEGGAWRMLAWQSSHNPDAK